MKKQTIQYNSAGRKYGRKTGIKGPAAQIALNVYLWLVVLLALFPLAITILFSLKGIHDFDRGFWTFPSKPMWSNYAYGFTRVLGNMANSICVGLIVSVFVVGLSSFVAYVFSRRDFYGKTLLFSLIIALMMVPGVLTMTPRYLLVQNLGIKNTWFALILPWISGNQAGAIFLFRTFMGQQPKELFESAKIDGAGDFAQYFYISIPLTVPILIIQFINTFTGCYNEYVWSMLVIDKVEMQMLMPQLKTIIFEASQDTGNAGITYAMYLISSIPLIITSAVGLKFFINGDFAGGLKL